ncbi:hypothetical protein CCACVL1_25448 [Corchorus capsularis]|uniref:RNase H type-1 domain-containing protein n=1 Tax=Corchorus capsularis TaxID=210143 RepID=A0A1R3GKF6_COCAP|nr:hypothetical protein CCACVL1_25448 [Corchorus capsularis]
MLGDVEGEVCCSQPLMGEWILYFDGSATATRGGAGVVLVPPEAEHAYEEVVSMAFKLDFQCTNNQAEYEALILGLNTAKIIGVTELCIIGDSNLVTTFSPVRCEHSPRSSNRYADALATLASKIHIPGQKEEISLLVQRWSVPGPLAGMTEYYLGEVSKDADWRTPIIEQLRERKSSNLRFLKSYTIIQGALYYRGPNGILARCISPEKAKERLRTSHKQWCGMEGPPLYRRMQRDGYYWRTMSSDCADAQYACPRMFRTSGC